MQRLAQSSLFSGASVTVIHAPLGFALYLTWNRLTVCSGQIGKVGASVGKGVGPALGSPVGVKVEGFADGGWLGTALGILVGIAVVGARVVG